MGQESATPLTLNEIHLNPLLAQEILVKVGDEFGKTILLSSKQTEGQEMLNQVFVHNFLE